MVTFCTAPDTNERALVLEGQLLNSNLTPITQCQTCEEYFKDSQKWVLLIKNNLPMHVNNGMLVRKRRSLLTSYSRRILNTNEINVLLHSSSQFPVLFSPFFIRQRRKQSRNEVRNRNKLRHDFLTPNNRCLFSAVVKQWKNLGSSSQGTAPTKRRKTEPT